MQYKRRVFIIERTPKQLSLLCVYPIFTLKLVTPPYPATWEVGKSQKMSFSLRFPIFLPNIHVKLIPYFLFVSRKCDIKMIAKKGNFLINKNKPKLTLLLKLKKVRGETFAKKYVYLTVESRYLR